MYRNYEVFKLSDPYGIYFVILFYALLIAIFVWSLITKRVRSEGFLPLQSTVELRGFAIMLVLSGHIIIHVLGTSNNIPSLSAFGVAIFFTISGYGLAVKYGTKKIFVAQFIKRRITRVMLPYWFATVIILFLDFLILQRSYSLGEIFSTVLGINFFENLRHLDYVRWYITVLLLWYVVFIMVQILPLSRNKDKAKVFGAIGVCLVVCNYYYLHMGYAFLMFPFGVIIGYYRNIIYKILNCTGCYRVLSVLLCGVIIIGSIYFYVKLSPKLRLQIPGIIVTMGDEISFIMFVACILTMSSVFLASQPIFGFLGKYSYEIFLFHGPLMIKYDLILFRWPLLISFWLYLLLVISICIAANKLLNGKW